MPYRPYPLGTANLDIHIFFDIMTGGIGFVSTGKDNDCDFCGCGIGSYSETLLDNLLVRGA